MDMLSTSRAKVGRKLTSKASILRLSVVIPIKNEVVNINILLNELYLACSKIGLFEVIYVDDASTDGSLNALEAARVGRPWLRILSHSHSSGQSSAIRTGVWRARAPIIATLDGDGQNDPAFLPALFAALEASGPGTGLVQGQRIGRKDGWLKTLQSRVANGVRGRVLKDFTRDTGCGLKVFY